MDATPQDTKAPRRLALLVPALLACACANPAIGSISGTGDRGHHVRSAASHRACIRPIARTNRLYRRANDTLAYWRNDTFWTRTLPPVPANAVTLTDGVIFHEGSLHVPWQTEAGTGLARIVADDTGGYRLLLNDGTGGPRITRQAGGGWELSDGLRNYARGSVLAHVVPETVTSDPRTLHHAAGIIESLKLGESELVDSGTSPGSQELNRNFRMTTLLAVGLSFVETLPARLRDPNASVWTPNEVRIIAPDIARHIRRPLAIHNDTGVLDFVVHHDGDAISPEALPANTVRLTYDAANRYGRVGREPGEYPTIFAAVEAAIRPPNNFRALDAGHQEQLFRTELAAAIDAAPMRPRLERMHERWLNPIQGSHVHKRQLRGFSRLRQLLFDRHHSIEAQQENTVLTLLQAILPQDRRIAFEIVRHGQPGQRLALFDTTPSAKMRIVIEADLDAEGRRVAYYRSGTAGSGAIRSRPIPDNSFSPIIDVLLNADDGRVRKALGLGEWDFQKFADRLLERAVDGSDALLAASLQRLVVDDPAVLANAEKQTGDNWTLNEHHYVRLRDVAGRTQIVETLAPAEDGSRQIPGYSDKLLQWERGHHVLRDYRGAWMPTPLLRAGFDPLSASFRHDAAAAILANLPAHVRIDMNAALRIADTAPYSILATFLAYPSLVQVVDGEIALVTGRPLFIDHPTARRYRTGVAVSGQAIAPASAIATTPPAPPRPATPLTQQQTLTPAPRLRNTRPLFDSSAPVSSADIATLDALLASGAPIGEFITRGVGSPHIQALITARRWRRMLREDEYMVLVGTAAGHVMTLAMPINAASIALTRTRTPTVPVADLPPGTRIIDDWHAVSAAIADYPTRVRAVADQWEGQGREIETLTSEGTSISTPSAFTERMLSSAVQFNLWSPVNDPINEVRYLDYIHTRYATPRATGRAGFDWLDSPAARSEYARYFPDDSTAQASVSSADALVSSALDLDPPSFEAITASNASRPSVIVPNEQARPTGSR